MANKASLDFGNSNTVIAVWNDELQKAETVTVPGLSAPGSFFVPSRIAYEPEGQFFVGAQIETKASARSREFRWMKRYINLRSPYTLRIGDIRIDAKRAAEDFLHTLTAAAFSEKISFPDELVLSVPVESFEHYSDWLLKDMKRFDGLHLRLVDEASAAAAGYGLSLRPGDTLLVMDFGGSTLQAVCVSVMEEGELKGRCCRVLGKAGCTLGGMTLDRWIFEDVLRRLSLSESDPMVRRCSAELISYCEQVKMSLSREESVLFDFFPDRAFVFTAEDLTEIFRTHGLFDSVDHVLEESIRMAEDHGLTRGQLTAVLPVGGSCLCRPVRDHLSALFPAEKIVRGEPLSAVARGAAVIAGGMHIYDFIQHSYAIRYSDPQTGAYAFRTIIPKGTKYPDALITGTMRLKASFDGQQRFGIAIYELLKDDFRAADRSEIFFDMDGSVHVLPLTEAESVSEQRFWMNEHNPLFLTADSAAERGTPQFAVHFGIDSNKMLLISAENLVTGEQVLSGHPVIRLI